MKMTGIALKVKILKRKVLNGIPSASGIAIVNNSIYVIGDNSPWLFTLNDEFDIASKTLIKHVNFPVDDVIRKSKKPDFEAFEALNDKELLMFGSGSKSPKRDVLVRIDCSNKTPEVEIHSLEKFYNNIRSLELLKNHKLNIEAAAIENDQLFLFNRRKNLILEYSLQGFLDYISYSSTYPEPKIYEVVLPEIKDINAGFSGATMIHGEQKIIFSASVENTSNAIDDGQILGSYIGIIDLKEIQQQYEPVCIPVLEYNEMLPVKIESITISRHVGPKQVEILMVTDSDGGDSEIISAILSW